MKDLKTFRIERGMSQKQIADASELTEKTIRNIEAHKTLPQADVRRRIEIVLSEKIDWLTTCGLIPVRAISWESAESEYRKSLLNVHGLDEAQQELYMEMSVEYLKSLICLRGIEKQLKAKRIIQSTDNDVLKRKRTSK